MSTPRDHVLATPNGFLVLRIFQLITAIAILGLAGYGLTYLSFDGLDLTMFSVSTIQVIEFSFF